MLAGAYAVEYVAGMQEEDEHGHPKMIALLKHFTAYSQETGRGSDSENISAFDLFDSYLPQYKIAFDGGATGAMCSCECRGPSCSQHLWDTKFLEHISCLTRAVLL